MAQDKDTGKAAASTSAEVETQAPEESSYLSQVVKATEDLISEEDAKTLMQGLINEVDGETITWDKSVTQSISKWIDRIDQEISSQLATIMHTGEFQKLEGSWRGFHHLVFSSETSSQLKIKVLNATQRELAKDLENAIEFDQSKLYKKIYEAEFGSPGGEPYGALIGDFEFTKHPEDIEFLGKLSELASAAFCPFISAASPKLLNLPSSFTSLPRPRDLAKVFDGPEYVQWRALRESEDARFVSLTLPRSLARLPYGKGTKKVDEFGFEEVSLSKDGKVVQVPHDQYCWMNTAYVLGAKLSEAFSKTGWCTAIRGAENGGRVSGLPAHLVLTDDGDHEVKCPTEIGITDRREKELSDLGFLSLCHYKNTDYAVFFGSQSIQKPKSYGPKNSAATANAAISARLPYIMATSRIAHYLKVIARDKIGSFMEPEDCQEFLNNWIADYICADEKPTAEMKARFPLAEAKIEVREIEGKPGSYHAIAWLRPWLQMEELTTSLRLVAEIPERS